MREIKKRVKNDAVIWLKEERKRIETMYIRSRTSEEIRELILHIIDVIIERMEEIKLSFKKI